MKADLNYNDRYCEFQCLVEAGDKVIATEFAKEFGFTPEKEYVINYISDIDLLNITNDHNESNDYSVDYFKKSY